jgi:putative ABC transport system ATP-binding protein/lipoprotein-releasing system ATP-binding protein
VTQPLVIGEGAGRTFGKGPTATVAVQPADFTIEPEQRVALVGPSGSGKSTLLHLMAGLDEPTVGTMAWPAIGSRSALRPGAVAVIFQGPSLLPPLSVLENVALPLVLGAEDEDDARSEAMTALELLGLVSLADKLPEEISGGQAQRVAVARALAGRPRLILADEPTGQLDHGTAAGVVETLLAAADHGQAALVVSTHDPAIAGRLDERWEMHDGRLLAAQGARA